MFHLRSTFKIVLLCLPFLVKGEDWTLKQCIEYAFANNSSIQKMRNLAALSQQNQVQAQASRLPTLNAAASHNYNWGRAIDPFTNIYSNQQVRSNNISLNGSLVLFNGFYIHQTIQQTKLEKQVAETDIQQAQLDVSINILQSYLSILLQRERLILNEQQVALTSTQVQRMEALKSSGAATESQVLDLKALLKMEEANLIIAKNNVKLAQIQLALLLELPDPTVFNITAPVNLETNSISYLSAEEAFLQAKENIPQLKSLQYKEEALRYQYSASKGRYYPRLTLNGSLSTLYSTTGRELSSASLSGQRLGGVTGSGEDVFLYTYTNIFQDKPAGRQLEDNFGKFVGLTLTVPLLNGLQTRTTVQRTYIQTQQASLDTKIALLSVQKNVYTYYYQAVASQEIFQAQQSANRASEESYRSAQKRLENGVLTPLEYTQIKTRWVQSNTDVLTSKYDFLFKNSILDIYTGKPLSF
ncbi:MAG: TolC family protein [Cytophagaceae bacterium]|nr:TolC family protein [Cytophagaceae bacterium]